MPQRPELRFLFRACTILVATLLVWWIFLLDPLRGSLRFLAAVTLHLLPGDGSVAAAGIEPDGNWTLRVPVSPSIGRQPAMQRVFGRVSPDQPLVNVRSLRLTLERKYPILFTVSLPLYWALILAAGRDSRMLRALLTGSAILVAVALVSLDLYVIHAAIVTTHLLPDGLVRSLSDCVEYAIVNVIPYFSPLFLALVLQPRLGSLILSVGLPASERGKELRAGVKGRRKKRRASAQADRFAE